MIGSDRKLSPFAFTDPLKRGSVAPALIELFQTCCSLASAAHETRLLVTIMVMIVWDDDSFYTTPLWVGATGLDKLLAMPISCE